MDRNVDENIHVITDLLENESVGSPRSYTINREPTKTVSRQADPDKRILKTLNLLIALTSIVLVVCVTFLALWCRAKYTGTNADRSCHCQSQDLDNESLPDEHQRTTVTDVDDRRDALKLSNPVTKEMQSCNDLPTGSTSGVYSSSADFALDTGVTGAPRYLRCDWSTAGGPWTLIQRRVDGSVEFNRTWAEYVTGFGSPEGNFWLGLQNIYRLASRLATLRVDLWLNGEHRYAIYRLFTLLPPGTKGNFTLLISGYQGNAGDSLSYHSGLEFSTFDNKVDKSRYDHCGKTLGAGWWYNDCDHANLNGRYNHTEYEGGINWDSFPGYKSLLTKVEMKLKV